MKKSKITLLNNAYKKRFESLVKYNSTERELGLEFFVEHLEYLRDLLILTNVENIEQEPTKTALASIATAIAEFGAYRSATDREQKKFHWNSFCDFVKLNMEEWLALNDSV
jgi:hypothetical protein